MVATTGTAKTYPPIEPTAVILKRDSRAGPSRQRDAEEMSELPIGTGHARLQPKTSVKPGLGHGSLPRSGVFSGETSSECLPVDRRKLLVATALEHTWGTTEPIVFLGEWCKLHDRRHVWGARSHDTVSFHWNDFEKLKRDYDYLQTLHQVLLSQLAAALNQFHQRDCSIRYWQILLDPWLMTYVAVMFDRWECIRLAFEQNENMEMRCDKDDAEMVPPFSYSEFITQVVSDEWNYSNCCRIVESEYPDKYRIQPERGTGRRPAPDQPAAAPGRRRGVRWRCARAADQFIGKLFEKYDVVFLRSYFDVPSLIRLNLALGQVPRLFLGEFDWMNDLARSKRGVSDRTALNWTWVPRSPFEALLSRFLQRDIPYCIIEGYQELRDYARRVPIRAKAIVTANAHWVDVGAKFWCAEQIQQGVKLVILEHGGSFPAYKELFNFEEDIADVRGTWFEPYHPKHVRVPPSKLVGKLTNPLPSFKLGPARKYCSVIDNDYPRWVYRAHFYAMADQGLVSSALIGEWYACLDEPIRLNVRVKPSATGPAGWNTRGLYQEMLGADQVLAEKRVADVFEMSRVVVCTCPETVFSEAMTSGAPTIMIYPDRFFERHPVAGPLLDMLRAANIVFHDPLAAATHVNAIWADPGLWWNRPDVKEARQTFQRQALYAGSDWLKDWTAFLDKVVA